jgi:ferredoxin-NADP reductase
MKHPYIFPCIKREEIAEDTMAFWLDKRASHFEFTAGQYADFTLVHPLHEDAEGNTRTFSIASAPKDTEIMIATRMRDTAFKNTLKKTPLPFEIGVSEPMGSFTLHADSSRPAIFLAGGIGATIARSIIASAVRHKLPHRLILFHSNPTKAKTPFFDDFEGWQKEHPLFTFIPTLTDESPVAWPYEHGRIDTTMIARHVPDLEKPIYYLSGPPGMVSAMITALALAGVNGDNIKTEEFAGY